MEVICILKEESFPLTIGKIYTAIKIDDEIYRVVADGGIMDFYYKWRFEPLDKHRERIINKIIDNT